MQNDSQALINQITAEWSQVTEVFKDAEKQYQLNLKDLILKYAPIPTSFEDICNESWKDLCEASMHEHPRDYLGRTHVLENILNMHINYLEYADDE